MTLNFEPISEDNKQLQYQNYQTPSHQLLLRIMEWKTIQEEYATRVQGGANTKSLRHSLKSI